RTKPHSHGLSELAGGGTGVSPVQAGGVKLQRAPNLPHPTRSSFGRADTRNSRKFPEPPATHSRIYPGTRPTCASSRPRSHPHAPFPLDSDWSLSLHLPDPESPSRRMDEVLQHYRPGRIARGHLRRPNSRRNLGRKENRSPHHFQQMGFRTRRHPGP